uniref:Uncharacterized protein n=1 Tax=Clytia hemisphaerica TaxID=252671 RepID=A0A7M5UXP2_9CNID
EKKKKTVQKLKSFERMVWYAITEFIWGSTETAPKTRAKTKLEEGWILVDTDKTPKGKKKKEVSYVEETASTCDVEVVEKKGKSKRRSQRKIAEDHHDDDTTDRKSTSRAKYLRDARRVLSKTDYQVVTVKYDDTKRRSKMPTARKLKRQELRKSFESPKKTVQQPKRRNH